MTTRPAAGRRSGFHAWVGPLVSSLDSAAIEHLGQYRRYHEPHLSDGRPVVLVGAAFDQATRNLEQWLVEEVRPAILPGNGGPCPPPA